MTTKPSRQRLLHLPITCGERTCASEPGKFCRYLTNTSFGSCFHCQLFSLANGLEQLKEKQGWLQRHPLCLALESKL